MRGPPTSDLDQRREEQLELVHARQKSQAKGSHIAISPSARHRDLHVQRRGGSLPMYDPRDRVFSSSNAQHVSEPRCASGIAVARIAPTVRSCAGARSTVFLIGNRWYVAMPTHIRRLDGPARSRSAADRCPRCRIAPIPREPGLRPGRRCAADHCAMGALASGRRARPAELVATTPRRARSCRERSLSGSRTSGSSATPLVEPRPGVPRRHDGSADRVADHEVGVGVGCDEQHRVDPVEQAAVAGEQRAGVLDADRALDQRLGEVT